MGKKTAPQTETKTASAEEASKYQAYFDANPEADELYVSSDDQVFTHEGWCKSHVKFLEDKTITIVVRPVAETTETEETPAP